MTTKRLFTSICSLALTLTMAWAQGPNGSNTYYQAANGKKGEALKTAMFYIINIDKAGWSYDGLKEAYKTTDKRPDGYLRDWYSNATSYTPGSAFSGGTSAEGLGYNREHLVPQSWFKEASPMKSDIWHVVPSDAKINNERGSDPLGEVGSSYSQSKNGYSKWGMARSGLGYTGKVFEPNDEVKGDIARAYFYMVTCYENKISTWTSSGSSIYVFDGNTYPGLTSWCLTMMMRWSALDPVDDIEIARNNVIAAKQNRNPFIDYPGLEDYIWGDKKDVAFSYDHYEGSSTGKQPVTMSFSPTSVTATLGESFTAPTLSTTPSGLTVTYSSSKTNVATVNASTGAVTLKAVGTTTITASFAGNNEYHANSASYTLTVKQQGGEEPTPSGENLMWESFSGYKGTSDSGTDLTPTTDGLDFDGWSSFTKTYFGNGACGKMSSSSANGSMSTKTIALNGDGVLTFKMKKFKTDASSLSLTVTGADADVTNFTPQSDWTDFTVNITGATGSVTLKFNATKRLYIDDIKLVSVAEEPTTTPGDIVKDGKIDWNDLKALVKILLGITPAGENIDSDAANVNGDDETNIADVTKLVNMILQNNK
ncbi:MAG: endonuclease [Bacteroidales bacterium]|nr:endonuclease [Bacteroidales bacterium]